MYRDVFLPCECYSQRKYPNKKIKLRKEKDSFLALVSNNSVNTSKQIRSSFSNIGRRTSRYISQSYRSSVTVEASLITPIYLYAIICLLFLLEVMVVQLEVRAGMHQASRNLTEEAILIPMLSNQTIQEEVVEAVGATWLDNSIILDGGSGLDCSGSSVSLHSGILQMDVQYHIALPVPRFLELGMSFQEELRVKLWVGYRDTTFSEREDIVYVTDTGSVYHIDYQCSHLQLSIHTELAEQLESVRNAEGEKYHSCAICKPDASEEGMVYVTKHGNHYHKTLNCSGLKRTIYAIPRSEVVGKGVCDRCG